MGVDNYTRLLLHFEGAHNQRSAHDSSSYNHSIYFYGNARIVTTHATVGSQSSLYLDGSYDYLRVPNNTCFQFGGGNFTLEAWVRFPVLPGAGGYADFINRITLGSYSWSFHLKRFVGENYWRLEFLWSYDGVYYFKAQSGGLALRNYTWYHFVVVRYGSNLYFYCNGDRVGSTSISGSFYSGSMDVNIGAWITNAPNTNYTRGFMDELRVSAGIARWTGSSFQLPTEEYGIEHLSGQTIEGRSDVYTLQPLTGQAVPLAATLTGLNIFAADPPVLNFDLNSNIAGVADVAGQLKGIAVNLLANVTGEADLTAALILYHGRIAGTIIAQGSLYGTAIVTYTPPPPPVLVEGTIAAQSGITAQASRIGGAVGTVAGSSTIEGDLAGVFQLSGLMAAQATLNGRIMLQGDVGGTISAQSGISGTVTCSQLAEGIIAAQSAMSGSLSGIREVTVEGNISAQSAFVGQIGRLADSKGRIDAHSHITGWLLRQHEVRGNIGAQSSIVGSLTAEYLLGGDITARSAIEGSLRYRHPFFMESVMTILPIFSQRLYLNVKEALEEPYRQRQA